MNKYIQFLPINRTDDMYNVLFHDVYHGLRKSDGACVFEAHTNTGRKFRSIQLWDRPQASIDVQKLISNIARTMFQKFVKSEHERVFNVNHAYLDAVNEYVLSNAIKLNGDPQIKGCLFVVCDPKGPQLSDIE